MIVLVGYNLSKESAVGYNVAMICKLKDEKSFGYEMKKC